MNLRVYTGREELIIRITVQVTDTKPQKMRLIASNPDQNNTVFTNRYCVFTGEKIFYIRMPLSPRVTLIQLYNEANGNLPDGKDKTFRLLKYERMILEKKTDEADISDADVSGFVKFAQRFCYNAGVLDTAMYISGDGKYKISYQPTLFDESGKEVGTPARIGEKTKIIDVSQKIFIPFTVPMRFAILCHEFAHCYRNTDKFSEVEADLQGLLIYLGLGYPRIEAYHAFLEVFLGARTALNAVRYDKVKKFIDDFETHKFLIYE